MFESGRIGLRGERPHLYDLAVELLDVARHNQAKIFDLERQLALRVLERLPELEDFAGSGAEEQEKIIRELRRDREVIEPFKKL
jgi:hypothetical protein